MLHLVRVALLVVLLFFVLSLVIAIGRPETGALEDAVLVGAVGGLFALAVPLRRIGRAAI